MQGPAIGSGCEIAACCDFVIATPQATFATPEALWGTVGATQRLPRILGKQLAKDMMFTGRKLNAEEARAAGLVTRIVDAAALDGVLADIAKTIACCTANSACARPKAASTKVSSSIRAARSRSNLRPWKKTLPATPGAPAYRSFGGDKR